MSSRPAPRGALIVLEGLDRSGKSTQCSLLASSLSSSGTPSELWRFPDRGTAIGQMIDAYLASRGPDLSDAAVHLLFSANRWEKAAALEAKLAEGTTLVVDRYAFSGVAFTAAKKVPGLGLEWCKAPDAGLPAPDAVMLLAVTPEVAAARGGYGAERYERKEIQEEVARQVIPGERVGCGYGRVCRGIRSIERQIESGSLTPHPFPLLPPHLLS